jgi:hypothetical protein
LICSETRCSCSSASAIGSTSAAKRERGSATPGVVTSAPVSSRNWTIIIAMSALLRVAERAGYDAATVEDFLAREHAGEQAGDPTAPQAAGAGAG